MTLAKRITTFLSALAVCFAMVLGSLSFMPKASAINDVEFPFPVSDLPSVFVNSSYRLGFVFHYSNNYFLILFYSDSDNFSCRFYNSSRIDITASGSSHRVSYNFNRGSWSNVINMSSGYVDYLYFDGLGSPFPLEISNKGLGGSGPSPSFSYSFLTPSIDYILRFFDFMPFYFPELPHGEFDGNINSLDGSYNISFPDDYTALNGRINQTGNDAYSINLNNSNSGSGSFTYSLPSGEVGWYSGDNYTRVKDNDTSEGEIYFNNNVTGSGSYSTSSSNSSSGTISQTAYANRLLEFDLTDFESIVSYKPNYSETSRFRSWSCIMDSSYCWFISDTRNVITGSIDSVTSDEVTWSYTFKDPEGGNTLYPVWAVVFDPIGNVIQSLTPSSSANSNKYTLTCSIGSLSQDEDSGIWSVDPLYHGMWFSQDSPPVQGVNSLKVADNKKYLANPVFGEAAFTLNFLDSIFSELKKVNSNLESLNQTVQSSISNQTNTLLNDVSDPAEQPSTQEMMDYFGASSAFDAPDTSAMFSGDIKNGHYWDGVTWWSSKFNDIIVSNETIVAFTTAMLTLGLAVLIIGRRFSMR